MVPLKCSFMFIVYYIILYYFNYNIIIYDSFIEKIKGSTHISQAVASCRGDGEETKPSLK